MTSHYPDCTFPFAANIVELSESRSGERLIRQWREGGDIAALNQNEAADPASPAVAEAIHDAVRNVNRYPDHRAMQLRRKLAEMLSVDENQLIFGNGSYEIIAMLCQVVLHEGSEIVIPEPTYRRYLESAMLAGARYTPVPLRIDGSNDPEALIAAAASADVLVVCTPNNPTGAALTRAEFRRISDAIRPDCLLVVDEAYGDFCRAEGGLDAIEELRTSTHPWVVIRTLSKAHGLAGLRFGYAVASHARIVDIVDGVRGLFNVGRLTQAAALAALNDERWSATIIQRTITERERMRAAVEAMGLSVFPSATNFLTLRVDASGAAAARELLSQGILVTTVPGAGYEDCVRISIGTAAETDRVVNAVRTLACRTGGEH